jgi:ABC-type glycerol-3-phosphate transport system substrate-binding protein
MRFMKPLVATAIIALAGAATACGSSSSPSSSSGAASGSSGAASGSSGAAKSSSKVINLTVWTDTVRQPGFEHYQKMHPNIHFHYEIQASGSATGAVNGVTLQQKTILSNRTGSGWPDIAFLGELNEVPEEEFPNVQYAADLTSMVPKSLVSGYPKGVLNVCMSNGQLICLRNDNAQNVLWYDAPLMKQWGYAVPTTWAQYEALGIKVAAQHPGYNIGDINARYGLDGYFWPAQCPYEQVIGNMKVRVDMMAPKCVEMAKLLDVLVKDKAVSTVYPFASSFAAVMKKTIMMPAADWFGAYKSPAKTWAAAPTPAWSASAPHWTGDEGGGVYMISKHSKNIAAALGAVEYMATNPTKQGFQQSSVTTPAYGPAEKAWAAAGEAGYQKYFYSNPAAVFKAMATKIWPGINYVGYDDEDTFGETMTAAAAKGHTLVGELPGWQKEASQLLKAAGYTVVNTGP